MPEWLHDKLAKQASRKGLTGDRRDAYIYGTLNKYEHRKGTGGGGGCPVKFRKREGGLE